MLRYLPSLALALLATAESLAQSGRDGFSSPDELHEWIEHFNENPDRERIGPALACLGNPGICCS